MKSLLPVDKVALKRLELSIKRVSNSAGIILVGVDTKKLSDEFSEYLTLNDKLITFDFAKEILSKLAYEESFDKENVFLANIYENEHKKEIINHLQFQRDFIPEKNIKIVIILSNESLEYLKTEAGDLYSTAKFSHSFIDHSFENTFIQNDEKLDKALQEYENYLQSKVQHNNILYELSAKVAQEAYRSGKLELSLEYLNKSLLYTNSQKEKLAYIYSNISTINHSMANYQQSIKYQRKALKIGEKLKDNQIIADSIERLAEVYFSLSSYKVSLNYLNDALKLNKKLNNKINISRVFQMFGSVYSKLGDYNKSLSYYNDALAINRESGDKLGESASLGNIGTIYHDMSEIDKALEYYKKALYIYEQINNKAGISRVLGNIGIIYLNLGKLETALEYQIETLKIAKEVGDKSHIANALVNISEIYIELEEFELALEYAQQSFEIAKDIDAKKEIATALNFIGTIYLSQNDTELSLKYQQDALKIQKQIKNRLGIANSLTAISNVYADQQKYDLAIKYQEDSLKISQELDNKRGVVVSLNELAVIYKELDEYPRAIELAKEALNIAKEKKLIMLEANVLLTLAQIYEKQSDRKEAKKNYLLARHLYEAMKLENRVISINKKLKEYE